MANRTPSNQRVKDRAAEIVSRYPTGTIIQTQDLYREINNGGIRNQTTMAQLKMLMRDIPSIQWVKSGVWMRIPQEK